MDDLIQREKRKGGGVLEEIRSGAWPVYTKERELECPCWGRLSDVYGGGFGARPGCEECNGSGTVTVSGVDILRILAFVGDPGAKMVLGVDGKTPVEELPEKEIELWCHAYAKEVDIRSWGEHLKKLASRLPGFGVVRNADGSGLNGSRWILINTAAAACGAYLPEFVESRYKLRGGRGASSFDLFGIGDEVWPPKRAHAACLEWLKDPTEEKFTAWGNASGADRSNAMPPDWVPVPDGLYVECLVELAQVMGPNRVREVGSLAVWEAIRGR